MRKIKHHFHLAYTVAVTCYCIWLVWACHAAYEAFDNVFLNMAKYIVGLYK